MRSDPDGRLPTPEEAWELSRELLGDQGTRLEHVTTAGEVAARLLSVLGEEDGRLLVVAATVHDIGYSPRIAHTGFHPYDGAVHVARLGWSSRLARLVANHSFAVMTVPDHLRPVLQERFPAEPGILTSALAYCDMHSAPDGLLIHAEDRLADIARRHADERQTARAQALRQAIAQIGALLEASGPGSADDSGEAARSAKTGSDLQAS